MQNRPYTRYTSNQTWQERQEDSWTSRFIKVAPGEQYVIYNTSRTDYFRISFYGKFNNNNDQFKPDKTFWNTGTYTDDTRSSLYVLVTWNTEERLGQVEMFDTIQTWNKTGWTSDTTVTLYGNNTNNTFELSGDDAAGFLTVAAEKTVTLDLNGRTIDLGSSSLTVSGNLTIMDSTATTDENGSYVSGMITSSNPTATVQETGGRFTLKSGIIENTYEPASNGEGGHAVQGGNFDYQGGLLQAKIKQVWDELKSEIANALEKVNGFFQLIFGTPTT